MITALLLPVLLPAKRPKNVRMVMTEPVMREDCTYSDYVATIAFSWSEYRNYGVTVTVSNETDSRIYVEWGNARIDDEPVCFGNDNMLTYRDRKEDEVVHVGSKCQRLIVRQSELEIDGRDFFPMRLLREYGRSGGRTVIIPVRHGEEVTDYVFKLEAVADRQ